MEEALNVIPVGRHLPRTPVQGEVLAERDSGIDTSDFMASKRGMNDENAPKSECFPTDICSSVVNDSCGNRKVFDSEADDALQGNRRPRRPSVILFTPKTEEINSDCFVKGMVGYQWTQEDLDFVESNKCKKLIQELKAELSALLKQLGEEQQRSRLTASCREELYSRNAEMEAFDLTMCLARGFLSRRCEAEEEQALDPESLLEKLPVAVVQQALQHETATLAELERRWTAAEKLRKLQEKQSREVGLLEDETLLKQAKVDGLTSELSELKSRLMQARNSQRGTQKQKRVQKVLNPAVDEGEMGRGLRRSKRIANRKQNL
ncbi:hypothetical protein GJAV_G00205180 [Gymnothorax javanicus]|nr:hypothetical protein GJAV_G00205180 [Gymnothorax javanicus]